MSWRVLGELAGEDLPAELAEAVELLADVTDQDIEPAPEGGVRIREGVAPDRVISVTDPEMRHGHKSNRSRFDGYRLQVAVDPESELVTGVAATPANVGDAEPVPEMLDAERAVGLKPPELIGDTAYGGGDLRAALRGREIEVVAPVPRAQNRKGLYPKTAFAIDLSNETCRCPAGQTSHRIGRRKDGSIRAFGFAGAVCRVCPLRTACTLNPAKGRTVTVHEQEALLQQARAFQQTEAFARRYRERPKVERRIADLVRHGLRQARLVGTAKVNFQGLCTAAMANIKQIARLVRQDANKQARWEAALSTAQ